LDEEEMAELAAYLQGLGFSPAMPLRPVSDWQEAAAVCQSPSDEWWRAEEAERERLERNVRLDPVDRDWLELNSALIRVAAGAASYAAYQARLARAAGAASGHPFLRKYALYGGGRWPLGVYDGAFAIF
jgi:hypothetical protein